MENMENNFDVIIAGCGAAGLYGAINLPSDCRILLLCKQELTLCNSALAQGGIAGVYKSPEDSIELHEHDTMVAGGFTNNPETVHILTTHAAHEIQAILDFGVDFDRTPDGELHRTLEGGHSRHRIFHHKDATGAEILDKLLKKVKTLPNVTILEHAMMTGMQKTDTGFSVNVMQGGSCTVYSSHFMILATGGIGRVYRFTTNSKIATGDGIAFAYENGAEIRNLHLIQFHPTAFNDHHTRECFLISEAVRGEGAYLLNCNKERFMDRYDERLELAPRDVVSHAIILESRRTHSDNFYLDISYKDSEFIKNRFPMIYEKVLEQGYDMTKEPIPIFPCQHYLMGGIQVDDNSETTVPNLYAAGESPIPVYTATTVLPAILCWRLWCSPDRRHWTLPRSCRTLPRPLPPQNFPPSRTRRRFRKDCVPKFGRSCRTTILLFPTRKSCRRDSGESPRSATSC